MESLEDPVIPPEVKPMLGIWFLGSIHTSPQAIGVRLDVSFQQDAKQQKLPAPRQPQPRFCLDMT